MSITIIMDLDLRAKSTDVQITCQPVKKSGKRVPNSHTAWKGAT